MTNKVADEEVVGLVPAAGLASRLAPLPLSKELLPVGLSTLPGDTRRLEVVGANLLGRLRDAGVQRAFLVLRSGKWDIPAYFGDGSALSMDLAYLIAKSSHGVPYTLDSAYAFVRHKTVAVGFPDILYPSGVFEEALRVRLERRADGVLGLFPALAPERSDMVAVNKAGRIETILVKPEQTDLTLSWGMAVWSARFSDFLHDWVERQGPEPVGEGQLGRVFLAAAEAGLELYGVPFGEPFLDIGTLEGYRLALAQGGF